MTPPPSAGFGGKKDLIMPSKKLINKPFDVTKFSNAIIGYRMDNDIACQPMADMCGVARLSIFRAESQHQLDLETIRKICNVIGVPVQNFM